VKKLKVLQLCHDYEGPFVSVCSMYLHAFDRDKHDITTVFLRGKKSKYVEESMAGTKVVFLELAHGSLKGIKLRAIHRVLTLCRQEHFDLVIAHRYKAIYVAGMVSFFTPFKLLLGVAHEHDVFTRLGRKLFLRFWRPNVKIVGVSESVRSDILRSCPTLNDRNRVYRLPNCIDLTMRQHILGRNDARRALGLDSFSYTFGTIGRLVGKKEHEILLRALTHQKLQQCRVVIIGSGSRFDRLEALAEKLGVRERVIFAGHVHQAFKYLTAFDAFVLPSGEKEAFGLVLLEAMMAKIPIISTDAKGPLEVVGDTGLLFKHGDADDLSARMIELRHAGEEAVSHLVERAYDRLISDFHAGCFRRRFWELPPVKQMNPGSLVVLSPNF
jgi:glycosyltransferase involved in cell wall biosynthesis